MHAELRVQGRFVQDVCVCICICICVFSTHTDIDIRTLHITTLPTIAPRNLHRTPLSGDLLQTQPIGKECRDPQCLSLRKQGGIDRHSDAHERNAAFGRERRRGNHEPRQTVGVQRLGLCLCVGCDRRVFGRGCVCGTLCETWEAAQDLGVGCFDEGLG